MVMSATPVAPTEATDRNFTDADLLRLAQIQTATANAPAGTAPVVPENNPEPNAFQVGQLVTHTFDDDYDGATSRDGIVTEVVADDGTGPKVVLSYLEKRTGNILESQITAV